MRNESIDNQLRAFEQKQDKNWQRLIFNLRKHLDIWAHRNIHPDWGHMKISYLPIICNISVDGSTAAEIGRKSMITKQNISRTIKELEEKGMIVSKENKNDKRSERLELTESGKQLMLEASSDVFRMGEIYKDLVGEMELEIAVSVLNKILKYHETLIEDHEDNIGGI